MRGRYVVVLGLLGLALAPMAAVAQVGTPYVDYEVHVTMENVQVTPGQAVEIPAEVTVRFKNLTCLQPAKAWANLTLGPPSEIPAWAVAEWAPRNNVTFTVGPGPQDGQPIKSDQDVKIRITWDPFRTPVNATYTYKPGTQAPSDWATDSPVPLNNPCVSPFPGFRHFPTSLVAYSAATPPVPVPVVAPQAPTVPLSDEEPVIAPGDESPFPGVLTVLLLSVAAVLGLRRRR